MASARGRLRELRDGDLTQLNERLASHGWGSIVAGLWWEDSAR